MGVEDVETLRVLHFNLLVVHNVQSLKVLALIADNAELAGVNLVEAVEEESVKH